MSDEYPQKAKDRVTGLISSLRTAVDRDAEQEVTGMAIPVLDTALIEVRSALGDDPVVSQIADVITPEAIEAGEPIRAIDALLVPEQLDAAIGDPPMEVFVG